MLTVCVVIPGEPHAQMRPRTRVVQPKGGGKAFATIYDPPESEEWKKSAALVMQQVMEQRALSPLTGALHVRILAVFEIAKSHHRKQPVPRSLYTGTKDLDNIEKVVWDAASGVLFVDDRWIAKAETRGIVGAQGEAAHVIIRVDQIEPAAIDRWSEVEGERSEPQLGLFVAKETA